MESENEELQRQLTEERFELHRIRLEMEKGKLEFERSTNEYLKGKEFVAKKETQVCSIVSIDERLQCSCYDVSVYNQASYNEIQRLQYEKEQLIVSLRREERKRRDDTRQKQRVEEECKVATESLREAVAENDKLRESYRNYLSGLIQIEGKAPTTARSSRPQSSASLNQQRQLRPQSGKESGQGGTADQTIEDLLQSYTDNERAIYGQLHSSNESLEKLVTSYRQLYDHYR